MGLVSQTLRTVAQALLGLRLKVTLSCAVLIRGSAEEAGADAGEADIGRFL